MKIKPTAKFWDVRITRPHVRKYNGVDYPGTQNVHVMAVAETALLVVELVLADYPEATIIQMNHRGGDCAIVVQKDLLL